MNYLLQEKLAETSQLPFHLAGGGPYPVWSKLGDSGQIPLSNTPTITLLSTAGTLFTCSEKPMKSQDLVVCSCFFPFGKTDITPSISEIKFHILKQKIIITNFTFFFSEFSDFIYSFRVIYYLKLSWLLLQSAWPQIHWSFFWSYGVKNVEEKNWKQKINFLVWIFYTLRG